MCRSEKQLKMQGAIARVCMVVAAAIFNPILFPHENTTLPDQDEELLTRMREHEERLAKKQAELEKELSQPDRPQETHSEQGYSWYIWSTVSFIIFFTIELCKVNLSDTELRPIEDEDVPDSGAISPRTMVLKKDILRNFCDKCSCTSAHENRRVREFVEGFSDDLLKSLRDICAKETDMQVGDFVGVGSMFESWKVSKPLTCDLIVPFSLPEPYYFQFCLWCGPFHNIPPDMQGCGMIKVTKFGDMGEGCLCGSANLGEDMICLLHAHDTFKAESSPDQLLCSKNSHFLSKNQVMKWFQISLTKAWGSISHKYDFELTFRNLDAAGALKIRFRSGKIIVMNLMPVIQFEDTDAYFVSHFPSDCDSIQDPYWPVSFAVYERNLLKYYTKLLPQNPCHLHCLQVVTFLHRKQMGLTGKSALTGYHFKTSLLHLLLNTKPSMWGGENIDQRVRDLLDFLLRGLQEKRLNHVLIGNWKVPKEVEIPRVLFKAEPINLFRSLVLDKELYASTLTHFQEMLRNAPALLQEYTPMITNGGMHHRLNEIL